MSLRAAQDISSIASLRQGFNPCLSNVHYFLLSRSFILSLSFSMSFSLYPIHPILGMDLQWQMNMVGRVVGVCVCVWGSMWAARLSKDQLFPEPFPSPQATCDLIRATSGGFGPGCCVGCQHSVPSAVLSVPVAKPPLHYTSHNPFA